MTAYIAFPSGIIVNEDEVFMDLARAVVTDILNHAMTLSAKDGATKFNALLRDLRTAQMQMEAKNATRH